MICQSETFEVSENGIFLTDGTPSPVTNNVKPVNDAVKPATEMFYTLYDLMWSEMQNYNTRAMPRSLSYLHVRPIHRLYVFYLHYSAEIRSYVARVRNKDVIFRLRSFS